MHDNTLCDKLHISSFVKLIKKNEKTVLSACFIDFFVMTVIPHGVQYVYKVMYPQTNTQTTETFLL